MLFFGLIGVFLSVLVRTGLWKEVVLSLQPSFVHTFFVVVLAVQGPNHIRRRLTK